MSFWGSSVLDRAGVKTEDPISEYSLIWTVHSSGPGSHTVHNPPLPLRVHCRICPPLQMDSSTSVLCFLLPILLSLTSTLSTNSEATRKRSSAQLSSATADGCMSNQTEDNLAVDWVFRKCATCIEKQAFGPHKRVAELGPDPGQSLHLVSCHLRLQQSCHSDLGNSNISGSLGPELGQLQHLQYLELYRNNFEGKIPKELGNLKNLISMDFYDNKFEGKIPKSIAKLKSLRFLRLNNNKLTGSIPRELTTLSNLKVFDVSNNNLCGTIPVDGPFANFPMERYCIYLFSLPFKKL
ncbi:Leucine-rich repeat protein 2 [Vitis vinifera]|uniref:Leucine-rich repeat protein 2 n=1 Tax=Vitis vinifera TaxID=29760 RepID=A0A438GJM5_VITVI|nr:Leucine-rich repeat protein 2 [Vitis vinifera]